MPQLDFREALSTPEEKVYAVTAAVPVASPQIKRADSFLYELGLSRSTWANIVFVAIAAVGGLVCAFYFFNGGELLRAAAAWPAEFLYPRPLSADQVEVAVQPNPVDQFSKDSTSAGAKNGDTQDSANQDFRPAQIAQVSAPTDTISSAPVPPPTGGTIFPPVTTVPPVLQVPPLPPVTAPAPDSVLTDVNNIVANPDPFAQSVSQTVSQTVTSVLPKNLTAPPVRSTVSSARKKVASTRQKPPVRSDAKAISQTTQKVTTQLQSPVIQNQTMFGGGMGAPGGIGAVGSSSGVGGVTSGGTGVGGVGSSGGIGGVGSVGGTGGLGGGVGGVGGVVGGLGGLGGLGGGVGGVIGGIGGGHH